MTKAPRAVACQAQRLAEVSNYSTLCYAAKRLLKIDFVLTLLAHPHHKKGSGVT